MKIINLIPMAGEGKRFKDEGFKIPKPLIDIYGKPMVIRALESLPKADKNILIVRKDVIDLDAFKNILDHYFDKNEIIEIDFLTEGQASTCLLAEEKISKNSILNIGACDIGFRYNKKTLFKNLEQYDSLIWSYNKNANVLKNPKMYGWIKTIKDTNQIKYVSCKEPISNDLLNDFVVSGTFTFKRAYQFFESVKKMIASNDRVNNEFYIDNLYNHTNFKSGIFKVDKHFSWGTPYELNNFFDGNF